MIESKRKGVTLCNTLQDLEEFWMDKIENRDQEIVILQPRGEQEDKIYANEYIHEHIDFELPKCCRKTGLNESYSIDFAEKAI